MLHVDITSFSYSRKSILRNIEFTLGPGEHLCILGESGCGKSTLLHLVYGLLHLENGTIWRHGKKLLGPTQTLIPGEESMKLVAQEFNVMPYSTVWENIGTYLSRQDGESDAIRINELLQVVDLEDVKHTLVKNLSGGQKQRVALAKALANEPEILLLDEPFSNIDSFRKNRLRRNLFSHLKKRKISCIIATHDKEEALSYSDKILMLKDGMVEMSGSPEEVYKGVSNKYQAGFFDEATSLPVQLISEEKETGEIILYPHQLRVSHTNEGFLVTVKANYFRGSYYLIMGKWNDREVFFHHPHKLTPESSYRLTFLKSL